MGDPNGEGHEPLPDLQIGARWERSGPAKRRRTHLSGPDLSAGEADEWEVDEEEGDDLDEDEYDLDEDEDEGLDEVEVGELDDDPDDEWEDEEEAAEDDEEAAEDEDWWDEDADDYAPPELTRTLRFGVLAMAPLFLGYELALSASASAGSARSVAEVVLSIPLEPFGRDINVMRRVCLGIGLALGFLLSRRQAGPLLPRTIRVVAEGALAALALGPLLALAAGYAEPFVGPLGSPPVAASSGGVQVALLAMGGAAYEEVVFRILLLSLVYVTFRRLFMWAGSAERSAGILAAVGAGLVSATIFAASHLAWATAWLGSGGEAFDASAFTWRICAGVLLALLMVWRGVGVAAWAHAFYNLSALISGR